MKYRVLVFLLLTTVVLGFSQQSDEDWYMGKPIRDIVFTGLNNVRAFELEAIMNPYKGRIFDELVFWEIQGKLYALEYFERIEPSTVRANAAGSEVVIRFNVVERPIVSRIVFQGNSGLRTRELQDVISTRVSDIFNQAKIRVDIEALLNKYVEKGYPNASVTAEETVTGDSSITVTFRIIEREKISITRIDFIGNSRFSNNTLRGQLSLKQRSLINDGAFQEAKLISDIISLEKYYHDRGYIDMVVRDVTRSYDSDDRGTNLVLTFMIEEGSEYRFGGISFQGNEIFSTDQLNRLVTSRTGDIVNSTRLENDIQRVADLYFENGYIFNSIMRIPDKNTQTNTLSYTIAIVERNRAYIENVIIIGNDKTKTDVILREIPLEPGDVFSKTKVLQALQNLYGLQFFSLVIPDTLQGSTENLMDLVFTVEETMTTNIQFGLTFSGTADPESFPISGLLEWTDTNLAGSGNELGVKVNSSIVDSASFSVNYMHRWILGLPLSLGIEFSADYSRRLAAMANPYEFFNGDEPYAFPAGFVSRQEYEAHNQLPPREYLMTYEQWYLSLGFSSGYRWLTTYGSLGLGGGFRLGLIRNTYDGEIYKAFDPTLRAGNNVWTPRNSFWISLSLDRRDIFYDPTSGYFLSERLGFYGIFNDELEHYIRSDTRAQYFYTLFNFPVTETWSFRGVLAFHLGLSLILGQPGRTLAIEDANKLAVDGMFIGRGWGNRYRNKGLLLLDSWIELRIPLVRNILAFDWFFDMAGVESKEGYYFGRNAENESNFTIENMLFSFGGGFRFTIPQFPIRISFAKRFHVVNGNVVWIDGPIWGTDLVISFALSY